MLIANLALCLLQEKPLQRQERADYVFADSLCRSLGLSPDLTVDVETCVAPAEDLPHQRKGNELFPEKHGEDLVGEDFLDNLVMEARDMVKSTIRGCASFGYQTVNVGMEVDAVTESLDYGHNTRHNLKACRCVQEFKRKKRRSILGIVKTT